MNEAWTRRLLHRFLPAHFHNPFALAVRLWRTGDAKARLAMGTAAGGLLLAPVDMLLSVAERRRYASAPEPRWPIVIVCGPPRSGTTLVAQVLVANLPLGYLTNRTALFPRSPLTSMRAFGGRGQHPGGYDSFYGKTRSFDGQNDALYVWDRWLGSDRTTAPVALSAERHASMRRFFGAWQAQVQGPVLAKNNSLNASAHLVAEALPEARFICLARDPLYLAQSLLLAREEIHGDRRFPYGLTHGGPPLADPLEDVCRQVRFHEQLARTAQERLGPDRFWILSYEAFCADPRGLVERVAREFLRQPPDPARIDPALKPFSESRRVRLEPSAFERLRELLARSGS